MPVIGNAIGIPFSRKSSYWTPLSLVVEDATPTHVNITFPSAKTVNASDFTIAGFTVLSGSWSGSVYTLVLSTSVVYGDSLAVVYKGKSYSVTNNVAALDSDAVTFLTAASITDATQKAALSRFVVSLKAINAVQSGFVDFATPANSKLKAAYPFIGGTAAKHKFNLINPVDSDAAYRLTFAGTVVHDAVGMTPNGSDGYADTHLSPLSVFNTDDHSFGLYLNTYAFHSGLVTPIGCGSSGAHWIALNGMYGDDVYRMFDKGVDYSTMLNDFSNNIGLHQINRTAAGVGNTKLLQNGRTVMTNTADAAGALPAETITFGKFNGLTYFDNRTYSFGYASSAGISSAANILFVAAVEKLQLDLGRCSLKNVVTEGHSMMAGAGATWAAGRIQNKISTLLNVTYANRLVNLYSCAIAGSTTAQLMSRYAASITANKKVSPYKNILVLWIGVNDLSANDTNGVSLWQVPIRDNYILPAIAGGWTVIFLTIVKFGVGWGKSDISRQAFNAAAIADGATYGFHVINLDLHSELSDPTNGTYFVDQIHLTDAAQLICANDINTIINTI
jgi:hypothetical protein